MAPHQVCQLAPVKVSLVADLTVYIPRVDSKLSAVCLGLSDVSVW